MWIKHTDQRAPEHTICSPDHAGTERAASTVAGIAGSFCGTLGPTGIEDSGQQSRPVFNASMGIRSL